MSFCSNKGFFYERHTMGYKTTRKNEKINGIVLMNDYKIDMINWRKTYGYKVRYYFVLIQLDRTGLSQKKTQGETKLN